MHNRNLRLNVVLGVPRKSVLNNSLLCLVDTEFNPRFSIALMD
jgi:hypothetical protein